MEIHLMNTVRTITLSISLALAAGAFMATHALATDISSGKKIAVSFDSSMVGNFGNMNKSVPVIGDESQAVDALAKFFGPTQKRVLVRTYAEYNALKNAALAAGVTTPERIAETEIIVVPEFAAKFGIHSIDRYALDHGKVTEEEKASGSLDYNDKVVTFAFNHITARAEAGDLKPIDDSMLRANQEMS